MLGLLSRQARSCNGAKRNSDSTIEYIVRRCHEANVKVLLNPAPAADLNPEWLELATYITPNEHELSALYLINLLRKHC